MADGEEDFKDGVLKFDQKGLKPTKTQVKDKLPTKEDIAEEKKEAK